MKKIYFIIGIAEYVISMAIHSERVKLQCNSDKEKRL